jgi:hypothetical protein
LIIPAVVMFWGWPGLILHALYGFSAITAYHGPESRLAKFLMWLAIPNLWCVAKVF